jgi:hypothetical protein
LVWLSQEILLDEIDAAMAQAICAAGFESADRPACPEIDRVRGPKLDWPDEQVLNQSRWHTTHIMNVM